MQYPQVSRFLINVTRWSQQLNKLHIFCSEFYTLKRLGRLNFLYS